MCGLEINILFKYQTSFIPFSSKRLSKKFQRKRYCFPVVRDKVGKFSLALDAFEWKFFTRKWNNSRFYIDFAICQRNSNNGFLSGNQMIQKLLQLFDSLSSCHRTVSGFSQLRSSYKKLFENQEFTWAGAAKTKLISLSTLARELGFHFV